MVREEGCTAEKEVENGSSKELHSITKSITGERQKQEIGVEQKQRVLSTETKETLQKEVEQFNKILNGGEH